MKYQYFKLEKAEIILRFFRFKYRYFNFQRKIIFGKMTKTFKYLPQIKKKKKLVFFN